MTRACLQLLSATLTVMQIIPPLFPNTLNCLPGGKKCRSTPAFRPALSPLKLSLSRCLKIGFHPVSMLEYVLEKMVNLLPSHVTSDYVFVHVLANTIIENKLIKS